MNAQTLNCPMCGAAASTEAVRCAYCEARLATLSCPSCFGMMFRGSKHCPHCGAKGARASARPEEESELRCPRCRVALELLELGQVLLRECGACDGVWAEAEVFEQICADREQQSAVLCAMQGAQAAKGRELSATSVRYVPCPRCGQLMNRLNFARCSGVIVDICKMHGTWLDRDELRLIVEFIRAGGLEASRTLEKEQLAEERRRLREEQLAMIDE